MKNIKAIIDNFVKDPNTKRLINKRFLVENGVLKFVTFEVNTDTVLTESLCMFVDNELVGNSSRLQLYGSKMAFGRRTRSWRETDFQQELQRHAIMIPFNIFKEANLDITKFKVIEKGKQEMVYRTDEVYKNDKYVKQVSKVHFTGACLFSIQDNVYLFDIDRREQKYKLFNAFLTKVPGKPTSIKDAYDMLKPTEVIEAEAKGLKVKRQGEWFFIPKTPSSLILRLNKVIKRKTGADRYRSEVFTLRAGRNRPNEASEGFTMKNGTSFVRGEVTHTGREHAKLVLGKEWYVAVPNTAVESFTIQGEID